MSSPSCAIQLVQICLSTNDACVDTSIGTNRYKQIQKRHLTVETKNPRFCAVRDPAERTNLHLQNRGLVECQVQSNVYRCVQISSTRRQVSAEVNADVKVERAWRHGVTLVTPP